MIKEGKDGSVNTRKLNLVGAVIVIGLTIAAIYVGVYIAKTESKRTDAEPASAAQVKDPVPAPVSPDPAAPSSAQSSSNDGAAPATAP